MYMFITCIYIHISYKRHTVVNIFKGILLDNFIRLILNKLNNSYFNFVPFLYI